MQCFRKIRFKSINHNQEGGLMHTVETLTEMFVFMLILTFLWFHAKSIEKFRAELNQHSIEDKQLAIKRIIAGGRK